jgi:hypothetical protein
MIGVEAWILCVVFLEEAGPFLFLERSPNYETHYWGGCDWPPIISLHSSSRHISLPPHRVLRNY